MMKTLIVLFFSLLISCSSTGFTSEHSLLIKEMSSIKKIEKKSINKTFSLFTRVNNSLEKKMDKKVINELGRLLELTFKVDSNYYTMEPFTGIIEKNEKGFVKALEKVLSKDNLKTLKANINMLKAEMAEGNG